MTDSIFELLDPPETDFHPDNFSSTQMGSHIMSIRSELDLVENDIELIILGCGEYRSVPGLVEGQDDLENIRAAFYSLEDWHKLKVADLGNIKLGNTYRDTYVALARVLEELTESSSKILVIGGSDELIYGAYKACEAARQVAEISIVDAKFDFTDGPVMSSENYLGQLLLEEPNFTKQLNLLAFQSYFVPPNLLEVLDNLRFDFERLGILKENISLAEPKIRMSHIFSFDMKSISGNFHQFPGFYSPNGLDGHEACALLQYAGMSENTQFMGIYNTLGEGEKQKNSPLLVAQMMWYAMDGIHKAKTEAEFGDSKSFNEFIIEQDDCQFHFIKSKRTGRWWVKLMHGEWLACSYQDYQEASNNHIPERWLRAMEK